MCELFARSRDHAMRTRTLSKAILFTSTPACLHGIKRRSPIGDAPYRKYRTRKYSSNWSVNTNDKMAGTDPLSIGGKRGYAILWQLM